MKLKPDLPIVDPCPPLDCIIEITSKLNALAVLVMCLQEVYVKTAQLCARLVPCTLGLAHFDAREEDPFRGLLLPDLLFASLVPIYEDCSR